MIAFAPPVLTFTLGLQLNPQPDGTVTLSQADGSVLSIQPDGRVESRPAGTNGPWEKATQTPQGLAYSPDGVHVYLVPFLSL